MIVEEKFETAREFIEALRITNPRWISNQNNWEVAWVFRGQGDANQQLTPSAWRSSYLERFRQKYRAKFERIYLDPLKQELEAIKRQIESGEITSAMGAETANSRSVQTNYALEFS